MTGFYRCSSLGGRIRRRRDERPLTTLTPNDAVCTFEFLPTTVFGYDPEGVAQGIDMIVIIGSTGSR